MGVLRAKVGGSWVDIGGNLDEVFVGTLEPTDPNTQLWFDSDATATMPNVPAGGAAGTLLRKRSTTDYDTEWSNAAPRGYIGHAIGPGTDSNSTSASLMAAPNTAVTWIADPTRRYKTTIDFNFSVGASATVTPTVGIGDAALATRPGAYRSIILSNAASTIVSVQLVTVESGLSGAQTRQLVFSSGGSLAACGYVGTFNRNSITLVEDIGGV